MKKFKSLPVLMMAGWIAVSCFSPVPAGTLENETEAAAPQTEDAQAALPVSDLETGVADIDKYGNITLEIFASSVLSQGYELGDIVTIGIAGQELDMPLVTNYSDVENGEPLCRLVCQKESEKDETILSVSMGNMAETLGIAKKSDIEEEPGFRWDFTVDTPVNVTISMKEKGGYADEFMLHQLVGSTERSDYPDLTDEEYANFRNVATTGMGAWALYRSSSPVNPKLNRNKEADEALNNAGIVTIMNLADNEETMTGYEDYGYSYYSQRDIIPLNMSVDYAGEDFQTKLAKGLTFFAEHEGPYLVHCTEGKDRCGFVSAVLESLMGASGEEVIADYMTTYCNYYGIEPASEKYDAIAEGSIMKSLAAAFGVEDIREADLAACAEEYLVSIGLSEEIIEALRDNLGRSYDEGPGPAAE